MTIEQDKTARLRENTDLVSRLLGQLQAADESERLLREALEDARRSHEEMIAECDRQTAEMVAERDVLRKQLEEYQRKLFAPPLPPAIPHGRPLTPEDRERISPSPRSEDDEPESGEKWRVGRSVGRTLYLDDKLVGLMDTRELAAQVVAAVNSRRAPPAEAPPKKRPPTIKELEAILAAQDAESESVDSTDPAEADKEKP